MSRSRRVLYYIGKLVHVYKGTGRIYTPFLLFSRLYSSKCLNLLFFRWGNEVQWSAILE